MSENGRVPRGVNHQSEGAIPMSGRFSIDQVAQWFMYRPDQIEERLEKLGIFVGQDGLVDMAELFAAMDAAPKGDEIVPILVEPLPQTGIYPLDRLCRWFGFERTVLLEKLKRLNINIDHNGCVDIADVIASIEKRKDDHESDQSGDEEG